MALIIIVATLGEVQAAAPADLPINVLQSLFAATTPSGKTMSAQQIKPHLLYATWPKGTVYVVGYNGFKLGVFLLSVRSDGTVAKVEILQKIGHSTMDREVVNALMKWRFRPGSVNEVRVPAYYTRR